MCVIWTRGNKLPPGKETLIIRWMDDATAGCSQVGNYSSWQTSDQEPMTHILSQVNTLMQRNMRRQKQIVQLRGQEGIETIRHSIIVSSFSPSNVIKKPLFFFSFVVNWICLRFYAVGQIIQCEEPPWGWEIIKDIFLTFYLQGKIN